MTILAAVLLSLLIPPNDAGVAQFCVHAERPDRHLVVAIRSGVYAECVLHDPVSDVDALLRKKNGRWTVVVSGGGAMRFADYRAFGVPSPIARDLERKRRLAEQARR